MQRLLTAQEIATLQARRPELFEPPELTEEEWRAATSSHNGKRGSRSRFWTDAEMWLSDLRYLTHWERGVWIDLRCLMWLRPGCSLPDNETSIARALGISSVQNWRQLRLKLLTRRLLVKRAGLLYITELFLQHKHSEKNSATASRNASQGWSKRRQNGGESLGEKDGKHADATRALANFEDF